MTVFCAPGVSANNCSSQAVPVSVSASTVQVLESRTDTSVAAGLLGRVATGRIYRCVSSDGSGSDWEPADGIYDITDFGAVSGTDVSSAVAAAVSTINARTARGGRLHFPAGDWEMGDFPAFTKHQVRVSGDGSRRNGTTDPPATRLIYNGSSSIFWDILNRVGMEISYLGLDCNSGAAGKTAFRMQGCQNCRLESVFAMGKDLTGSGNGFGSGFILDTSSTQSNIFNQMTNCGAVSCQDGGSGRGLILRESNGALSTNQNVFTNLALGNSDIGVEQEDVTNEDLFHGIEVANCTTGFICRGRNTVLEGSNIENCTLGLELPADTTQQNIELIGVNFQANTTDVDNAAERPVTRRDDIPIEFASVASITPDPTKARCWRVAMDQNLTINNPVNGWDGAEIIIQLQQGTGGGFTTTWDTDYRENASPDTTQFRYNSYIFRRVIQGDLWVCVGQCEGAK